MVQRKVFAVSGHKSITNRVYFPKIKFIIYYKLCTIKSSYLIFCIAIMHRHFSPDYQTYLCWCMRTQPLFTGTFVYFFLLFSISKWNIIKYIKKKQISRCNLWPSIRRRKHNYRKRIMAINSFLFVDVKRDVHTGMTRAKQSPNQTMYDRYHPTICI